MYQSDKFLETQERWVRCLDDCSMLDQVFAEHFYHVGEFLVMMSNNGITQNLTKFNSGNKDLEFYLRSDGFTPNTAMVKAIKNLQH